MNLNKNKLYEKLASCDICPHECKADRNKKPDGICRMGVELEISSYGPHYGEEPELVGYSGSGTIFFTGCNLLCVFCQNYDISHKRYGSQISEKQLSNIMLDLQEKGCCNINFVTPTHFTPQIIYAIDNAKSTGLTIPIVWNSSGYEKPETIKELEGLVDIYMPDLKFVSSEKSRLYSEANDYFSFASKAIIQMHKQVGDLIIKNGIARRGLLIRHLVLPNNQADTKEIIDFISDNIGCNSYLNLMEQYHPCYMSYKYPKIKNKIGYDEYIPYINYARSKGFYRPEYLFR